MALRSSAETRQHEIHTQTYHSMLRQAIKPINHHLKVQICSFSVVALCRSTAKNVGLLYKVIYRSYILMFI